jgi:hypothetical protein
MNPPHQQPPTTCPGVARRTFLADMGMGVAGMALGNVLLAPGLAGAEPGGKGPRGPESGPHFEPKAKSVIWLFLCGGLSPMETFDPKPALDKFDGKTILQTPYRDLLDPEKNPFQVKLERAAETRPILRTQTKFKQYGESGIPVSDFFPHIGQRIDDIAVVRSFWTTTALHEAQLQFHTGRRSLEGGLPTVGSWVTYGLGSLNQNLPEFVVLGKPADTCCGSDFVYGAGYLGPQYGGVRLHLDRKDPLPFLQVEDGSILPEERTAQLRVLQNLNKLNYIEYPDDPDLTARIKSYELAARMQTSVPDTLDLEKESKETRELYGLDENETRDFGTMCLVARRLAQRGVRFTQVFHQTSGFGPWDAHRNFVKEHEQPARQVDKPIAGLLTDLKRSGMLEETLVVCATEFGRTPSTALAQDGGKGREHNPFGFTCWLAGGGVKGGVIHGATDELGYHAVEDRHYLTDLHATVMHQLGLDSRRLSLPGRRRLDIDHGEPIRAILA